MDTIKNFSLILEKLILIQNDLNYQKTKYSETLEHLENDILSKKTVIGDLDTRTSELISKNQNIEHELELLKNSLNKREESILVREEELNKKEEKHKQDVEDERKVSFVRATQAQLKDKLDEIEILNKQLGFYKKQSELLNTISLKYCLNHETLSLDVIEQAILNGVSIIKPVETAVSSKKGRLTKKQLEEEEKVKQQRQKELEEQQQRQKELEEQQEDEDEVLEMEVEDYNYKGVMYYLDRSTNEIFSRLENDEIGEVVGLIDSKGKVKFHRKK